MKSKLLCLVLMAAATVLHAQGLVTAQRPWFCDVQGAQLHYVRTYAGNGTVRWTQDVTIREVSEDTRGMDIRYQSEFRNASGGTMYGGPIALEARVDMDGNLTVDFGASAAAMVRGVIGGAEFLFKVSYEHVRMETPATLQPGTALDDLTTVIRVGPLRYTVSVDQRRVLQYEDITTPAGTFHCVVMEEHKVEEGPAHRRRTYSRSWYARGIGVVRHDTYSEARELMESEILHDIRYPRQL